MPTKVEAYKCDWCGRMFGRACNASQHECRCKNNPAKRHCITCKHSFYKEPELEGDFFAQGYGEEPHGAWCRERNMSIKDKPYLVECDVDNHGGYTKDYPVPWTCMNYEYQGFAGWEAHDAKAD